MGCGIILSGRKWPMRWSRPRIFTTVSDQTAYKDQSRGQSIRSRLGSLLRTTPWRQDGDPPRWEKEAAPALEGTRGHLSRLQPTDHRDRAMAQSSHHLAHKR